MPYLYETDKQIVLTVHIGESVEYIAVLKAELEKCNKKLKLVIDQIEQDKLKIEINNIEELEGKNLSIFSQKTRYSHRTQLNKAQKEAGITLKEFAQLFGVRNINTINFAAFSGYEENESKSEDYFKDNTEKENKEQLKNKKTKKKKQKRKKPKRRKRTQSEIKAKKLKNEKDALSEIKKEIDKIAENIEGEFSNTKWEYLLNPKAEHDAKQIAIFALNFANQNLSDENINVIADYIVSKNYIMFATIFLNIKQLIHMYKNSPARIPQKIITLANALRKRLTNSQNAMKKEWLAAGVWQDARTIYDYMNFIPLPLFKSIVDKLQNSDIVVDLGAGQTIVSTSSFLNVLKNMTGLNLSLHAVDPAYKNPAPFPAALHTNQLIQENKSKIESFGINIVPAFAHELLEHFQPDSVALLVSVWTLDKLSLQKNMTKIFEDSILSIAKILKPGGYAIISPLTQRYVHRITSIVSKQQCDITVQSIKLIFDKSPTIYQNQSDKFTIVMYKQKKIAYIKIQN